MILPILLAFGTSRQQVMPPIWNHQKFSLFHCHAGPRHQNHRSWNVETTHDFRQMTRIWFENLHLRSRINLWYKHKFTNMVLLLCLQMSKLTVWYFWSACFEQHLRLQPSIEKRRKQNCTLNIIKFQNKANRVYVSEINIVVFKREK